ncbi:MAG: hypothetical protein ACJ71J_10945, partial [Nitrososphaeraceae archaeon]
NTNTIEPTDDNNENAAANNITSLAGFYYNNNNNNIWQMKYTLAMEEHLENHNQPCQRWLEWLCQLRKHLLR